MKKVAILILLFFLSQIRLSFCQNTFRAIVKDKDTKEALIGTNVFIDSLKIGSTTDLNGEVELKNIPRGTYTIKFSYMGYKLAELKLTFPSVKSSQLQVIYLEPIALESETVQVTSTRTNGVVDNVPVRVEVLGQEEVREEIAIKPGNISKLLGETSGIQVQQLSATTGNVTFRILGLQGRYTQLLKDGFPLYSGFSSGLSLLQIPPLDLLQVEVIKGSISALYGGDAIAGIVNLVSKTPSENPEWSVIFNQTHKKGRDISSFYSKRANKLGVTFLASQSSQEAVDVDNDGFTDIPNFEQTMINPKFFYYFNNRTSFMFSISSSFENRKGGDITAIESVPDSLHNFIENNESRRTTTQLKFEKKFENGNVFTIKNSLNDFERNISIPWNNFGGKQFSCYSEVSYLIHEKKHTIVLGGNYFTDSFDQRKNLSQISRRFDYKNHTLGLFAQDDWRASHRLIFETGVRFDHNDVYGNFFLPRISALYKFSDRFSSRFSYGQGYKLPTSFTDEAEQKAFYNVVPVSNDLSAETSHGLNLDLTYKFSTEEFLFSFNQAFYFTKINHALIPQLESNESSLLIYENAGSALEAKGLDTNLKIALDELVLFTDYTYTDVKKEFDPAHPHLELTPKHKLNLTLSYEDEQNWRTGFEVFYTGKQYLDDYKLSKDFWTIGFMAQKIFRNFSVIANVENIFDVRQSKFERVIEGTTMNPIFRPIYAPLDGVVANVALEVKLK